MLLLLRMLRVTLRCVYVRICIWYQWLVVSGSGITVSGKSCFNAVCL